jgi:hypothetical protein
MSSHLRLHQSLNDQRLCKYRSEDRPRVSARSSQVCNLLARQRNHYVWSLARQLLIKRHNWIVKDSEQNAQNQKDLSHVAASQIARSEATTTSNDPTTAVKLTSQSLTSTSNPIPSKPTARPPQSQYRRHSRHTRAPTHNTPALAPVPTPCTRRTTPSSKSPKQRTRASTHPPPSPLRLLYPTKSSRQIDTPPDRVTNAHNHGVLLFPQCGKSASKSTPQKTHDI